MMLKTVENQKIIHINREPLDKKNGFLGINKETWYSANKDLEPYGLVVYLYLASNANGFDLALSQEDAEQSAGIKKTSFHKYIKLLIEKGYLVKKKGNIYDFYEKPLKNVNAVSPREQNESPREQENLQRELLSTLCEQDKPQANKEINNINKINNKKYNTEFVF